MASKIKVDQIAGSSSGTVTIASGTTLNLASGASLTGLTIASGDLPTIPTTKGGTGLTGIGTAGQALKVNSSGTALEYGSVSADLTNLNASNLTSGTVATTRGGTGLNSIGTANQVLRVNSGATGLEFATVAGGGADTATVSSTATSGGTLILSSSSNYIRRMTGTSNHTVLLPDATTLTVGKRFEIHNESTGTITVNSYGGSLITTIPANVVLQVTCIDIATDTASSWKSYFEGFGTITGTGNNVLATNATLTSPTLTSAVLGTPASATLTNATGLPIVAGTTGTLTTARGGTGITTIGTAGQFLKVNTDASGLEYGGGDFAKLMSYTLPAQAPSFSITGFMSSSFIDYEIRMDNVTFQTGNVRFLCRPLQTDGTTEISSAVFGGAGNHVYGSDDNYCGQWYTGTSLNNNSFGFNSGPNAQWYSGSRSGFTYIPSFWDEGIKTDNTAVPYQAIFRTVTDPLSSTRDKWFEWDSQYQPYLSESTGYWNYYRNQKQRIYMKATTALGGFKFYTSTGNIMTATVSVYARKK